MERPNPRPGLRVFLCVAGFSLVAAVVFAIMSQALPTRTNERLFAETGPFEQASPWLWLALGAVVVATYRRATPGVVAGVIVCLACAAREWDIHKSFTGYSVLKPGFYLSREYALSHQIIAGTAVVALGVSALILLHKLWRLRPWASRPRPAWFFALAYAFLMLVLTKVLDRTPAILRDDFGFELPEKVRMLMAAWEEGMEMLLPVFFAGLVLSFAVLMRSTKHRFQPEYASER